MAGKRKITDDSELTAALKKGNYGRGEKVRNTYNRCIVWGIWIVFLALIIVGAIFVFQLVKHMVVTNNYEDMENALKFFGTAAGSYFVAYLRHSGVKIEQ